MGTFLSGWNPPPTKKNTQNNKWWDTEKPSLLIKEMGVSSWKFKDREKKFSKLPGTLYRYRVTWPPALSHGASFLIASPRGQTKIKGEERMATAKLWPTFMHEESRINSPESPLGDTQAWGAYPRCRERVKHFHDMRKDYKYGKQKVLLRKKYSTERKTIIF